MKQEIERKFLVTGESWRTAAGEGIPCKQGYIGTVGPAVTVRVRLMGGTGFLTLKGPAEGISRPEMEYEVPAAEAVYMLEHFCTGGLIEKKRYFASVNGLLWEIDEFAGDNAGLVLAEIELEREDQPFKKPEWLGEEVSMDRRYTNAALARNPFSEWGC
jgi:adenylate cyclase